MANKKNELIYTTRDVVREAETACRDNAIRLLRNARILFDARGSDGLVYVLWSLAVEELGKGAALVKSPVARNEWAYLQVAGFDLAVALITKDQPQIRDAISEAFYTKVTTAWGAKRFAELRRALAEYAEAINRPDPQHGTTLPVGKVFANGALLMVISFWLWVQEVHSSLTTPVTSLS